MPKAKKGTIPKKTLNNSIRNANFRTASHDI